MLARGLPGATSGDGPSGSGGGDDGTVPPGGAVQHDMAIESDRTSGTGESATEALVRLLIGKHGEDASAVALARARLCRRSHDYAAALVWLELALLADAHAAPIPVRAVRLRNLDDNALRTLVRKIRHRHRDRA